jgi:hypothetical protein
MIRTVRTALALTVFACYSMASAAMVFNVTGVYDADTNVNVVDHSATSTSGNEVGLSDFKAMVSAAYSLGLGGVVNFDTAVSGNNVAPQLTNSSDYLVARYGTGLISTLNIGNTSHSNFIFGSSSDRTAVSGSGYLAKNGTLVSGGTIPAQNFGFGFRVEDQVVAVGATMISRLDNAGSATAKVLFSDGQSTSVTLSIAGTNAGDDTFFGFQITEVQRAAGIYITGLEFTHPVYRGIDDLAFIVAPEPRTASLLMLGLFGWVGRRRRQRPCC